MISLLIALLILCIIAGICYWILSQIPGIPAFVPQLVWIIVALILLVYLLDNIGGLGIRGLHL
jgi:hypothetical protein